MSGKSEFLQILLPAFLLCSSADLEAGELLGRVTKVISGDRILVRAKGGESFRVRLAGVDAPDSGQPFYHRSTSKLARLVEGKKVRVTWRKRDRSGDLVGHVYNDRRYVNTQMVGSGYAWYFDRLNDEVAGRHKTALAVGQQQAKAKRRGLWRQDAPLPPWIWRRTPFR